MAEQKENRFSGMTREEIILEAKKQIVRSAFLALAALIVIGVACYAWFVSGGTVTAITGPVTMLERGFELATRADGDGMGAYDKYGSYLDEGLQEGEVWSGEKVYHWTKGNQTIRWQVDQDSNLGNAGNRKGIRPNSKGTLVFYVIPKADGPLTVNCNLNMRPRLKSTAADEGIAERAEKLLRGHILFDRCIITSGTVQENESDEEREVRLEKAKTGYFQLSFPDAKANQPVMVTLNWFWPYILRESINHPDYGEMIENLVNAQDMADYFFYNNGETVNVANTSFKNLNRYYNNADQFIGDNVAAIVLELTADLAE